MFESYRKKSLENTFPGVKTVSATVKSLAASNHRTYLALKSSLLRPRTFFMPKNAIVVRSRLFPESFVILFKANLEINFHFKCKKFETEKTAVTV